MQRGTQKEQHASKQKPKRKTKKSRDRVQGFFNVFLLKNYITCSDFKIIQSFCCFSCLISIALGDVLYFYVAIVTIVTSSYIQ